MPWTMADAIRKTKKATSSSAKKQWAAVANNVLAKTGDDALAVKSANSAIKHRKKNGIKKAKGP